MPHEPGKMNTRRPARIVDRPARCFQTSARYFRSDSVRKELYGRLASNVPQGLRNRNARHPSFRVLSRVSSNRGRLLPQFQHSLNCPSISRPQLLHFHRFDTERSGASIRFTTSRASSYLPSSATQSSGQHSIGGNSPTALDKYKFFTTHLMPPLSRIFLRWLVVSGFCAVYSFFMAWLLITAASPT